MTEGRGADAVILAVAGNGLIRPAMDAARSWRTCVAVCANRSTGKPPLIPRRFAWMRRRLLGSYSASVDLQEESVRFVLSREMDLERLISHRFPLSRVVEALQLAAHPKPDSMKIVIQPGSVWKDQAE